MTRIVSVAVLGSSPPKDVDHQNVDVEVVLDDASRWGATFFTIGNIRALMARYQQTGECLNGAYFWSTNMIIVTELTTESIESAAIDLLASGEFQDAFARLGTVGEVDQA